MTVDGVSITSELEDLSEEEARKYIRYVLEKVKGDATLIKIAVKSCPDGKVDVEYTLRGKKFERIRRITGYLTGDLNTWNNAKRAEEKERVKHGFKDFEE